MKINGKKYTFRTPIADVTNEISIQNMLYKTYVQKFNQEADEELQKDPKALSKVWSRRLSYYYDLAQMAEGHLKFLNALVKEAVRAKDYVGKPEMYPGATYIHGYIGHEKYGSMLKLGKTKPCNSGIWEDDDFGRMTLSDALEHHADFCGENTGLDDEWEDSNYGIRQTLRDINLRILYTDRACSLEEAFMAMDAVVYGGDIGMTVDYEGYSEYSIEDVFLAELSIGGHDLLAELETHKGQYMHMVLENAGKE